MKTTLYKKKNKPVVLTDTENDMQSFIHALVRMRAGFTIDPPAHYSDMYEPSTLVQTVHVNSGNFYFLFPSGRFFDP